MDDKRSKVQLITDARAEGFAAGRLAGIEEAAKLCNEYGLELMPDRVRALLAAPPPPAVTEECRTCGQIGVNGLVGLGDSNEPIAPCPDCTCKSVGPSWVVLDDGCPKHGGK